MQVRSRMCAERTERLDKDQMPTKVSGKLEGDSSLPHAEPGVSALSQMD